MTLMTLCYLANLFTDSDLKQELIALLNQI